MANNIITAAYSSSNITYTKPAYQYDYGMILKFSGIELPQAYEVHFSNTEFCGESISQIGDADGVTIPDEMFLSGNPIYAWMFLHTGEDDGETVYKAVISVNKRAKPSDLEPTPVQQDAITQAIAALNVAVEQTAQDVISAWESAQAASDAADVAVEARDQAIDAKEAAEDAQEGAETAQGKAEDAQQAAEAAAGSVLGLTADATVDANVGTPSVEVEVTTESDHKNMSFAFHNLKGVQGDTGVGISSVVLNADYTLTITLTNGTSYTTSSIRGEVGATPNLTIGTVSTLPEGSQATATITGTDEDPVLNLGIPVGDTGDPGISPTITVTAITGGHNVEITDAQGTTDFDVLDGEITEDALEERLIDKADVIISSASGEIVTIQDGGNDLPVVDLSVSLLPVQDLHGQANPYPAGGGKNLFDENGTFEDHTYIDNSGNKQTSTATQYPNLYSQKIPVASGSRYVISGKSSVAGYIRVYQYTSSNGYIGRVITSNETNPYISWVASENASYVLVCPDNVITSIQLETGSTPTTWQPYSNVCPISGWTGVDLYQSGKNMLDNQLVSGTYNGCTITKNADGSITVSGTPSAQTRRTIHYGTFWDGKTSGNISFGTFSSATRVFARRKNKYGTVTYPTFTNSLLDANAVYDQLTLEVNTSYNGTPFTIYPQVEVGSQRTAYEAFNGNTYPISWQSSAGTVYGGSLDLTTGVLKSVVRYRLASELTWSMDTINGNPFFNALVAPLKTDRSLFMCEAFKPVQSQYLTTTPVNGTIYNAWARYSNINVYYPSITSLADWNTFIANNDFAICYPMTAEEYQLGENQISTLLGANNFWSNGNGVVDLEYRADTKLYIEQLTKPSEDDMVANANIASGKFFMIGNRLFLSTVAIAQGEQIVVGTNCSEVSLADALNQINA